MKNNKETTSQKIDFSGRAGELSKNKVVSDNPIDAQRREKVKEAMRHAWSSYEKYAWGNDELQVIVILLSELLFISTYYYSGVTLSNYYFISERDKQEKRELESTISNKWPFEPVIILKLSLYIVMTLLIAWWQACP